MLDKSVYTTQFKKINEPGLKVSILVGAVKKDEPSLQMMVLHSFTVFSIFDALIKTGGLYNSILSASLFVSGIILFSGNWQHEVQSMVKSEGRDQSVEEDEMRRME